MSMNVAGLRCNRARQVLENNGYTHKWVPFSSRALTIYGLAVALFIGMGVAELIGRDHHVECWSRSGLVLKGLGAVLVECFAVYLLGQIKGLDEVHAMYDVENEKPIKLLDDHYPKGSNALMSLEHVMALKSLTDDLTQKHLGLT